MVPVEDGHPVQADPLLVALEDLLAEEFRLLVGVGGGDHDRAHPRRPGRLERLGEPRDVVPDRGVGERDDLGGRAVVDRQLEDAGARVALGELEDVVVVGAPEPVDRLRVVADGRQVAGAGAGDRLDQRGLDRVRVLHLVDEDVAEHPPLRGLLIGELFEQPGPLAEQVVVVHAVGGPLAPGVRLRGGFELGRPVGQVRMAIGDQFGQGPLHVEGVADQVQDQRRLRGHLPRPDQPGLFHGQSDEVELVLAVEDREVGAVSQPLGRPAEQAIADVVKRPRPDPRRLGADQGVEPPEHLAGRAPGEGDEQDRLGGRPLGDQVGDAIGDDPRLARARPRQDQVEAVGGRDRRALRVVQVEREPLGEPVVPGLLQPNLPHASGSPGPGQFEFPPIGEDRIIPSRDARRGDSIRIEPGRVRLGDLGYEPRHHHPPRPERLPGRPPGGRRRGPGRVPGRPRRPALVDRHRRGGREARRGRRPALLPQLRPPPTRAGIKPTSATSSRSATARCWSTRSST